MKLEILLPNKIFYQQETEKIQAEGKEGYFILLPHHIDYISLLEPSIITTYFKEKRYYIAVDGGILIKDGDLVSVSTKNAEATENFEKLHEKIKETFQTEEEAKRKIHQAFNYLENKFLQRFQTFIKKP